MPGPNFLSPNAPTFVPRDTLSVSNVAAGHSSKLHSGSSGGDGCNSGDKSGDNTSGAVSGAGHGHRAGSSGWSRGWGRNQSLDQGRGRGRGREAGRRDAPSEVEGMPLGPPRGGADESAAPPPAWQRSPRRLAAEQWQRSDGSGVMAAERRQRSERQRSNVSG